MRTTPLEPDEKQRLLRANRERLERDMISGRLEFESMPRVVDLQLSNVCNMSCTMCYDGNNPPVQKMDEALAERVCAEVLPTASEIVPFAGSEPLIFTWDQTRSLAERYAVELDLITNAQFLDDAKFDELEPHVTRVTFSIDSHMRDVYERIRLRSKPDKVFANLPRAVARCREHGIEPQANVVFMVENAAYLEETVDFLAAQGCTTVRLLAFHLPPGLAPHRKFSDPLRYLHPDWLQWKMEQVRAVARQRQVRLIFEGQHREEHDFRPADLELRRRPDHSVWEELRHFYPGYCMQSVDRVKIHADGTVYPCCVAEGEDLVLGNVNERAFADIWNGPQARDLRRAMLTHDLPDVCKSCGFHTAWLLPERDHLPVVDWFYERHQQGALPAVEAERWQLSLEGPVHMARAEQPPTFAWSATGEAAGTRFDAFFVVLGVGGIFHERNVVFEVDGGERSFTPSTEQWAALLPNIGHWWTVWGIVRARPEDAVRAGTLRCVVRHQPIPRVAGSTLYGE